MKGRIGARSLVASLAVLLVAACGGSNVSQAPNQQVSMTVLYTAATDPLPVWVAADDGIFAAHHLDVTLKAVQGAGDTPRRSPAGARRWDS
jgi:ABC-type nitrate/sulfonate/bicarbonate transport system substrate-binding protein